jgi:hypothetical protein
MTHDKSWRFYANLSQVEPGDWLIPDGGFTCMKEGVPLLIERDDDGLYVRCDSYRHYLSGQADEDGYLVGLFREDRDD